MTTQRTWTSEEKLRIVAEGLSPKANVSDMCRHYGVSSTTLYQWKEQALAAMKAGLKNKEGSVETALRQENAHQKRLVAEHALGLQIYKDYLEGQPEGKRSRREVAMMMVMSHLAMARVTGFTDFARSTLYYPRRLELVHGSRPDEPKVRGQIRRVALAHPTFGVRRVWAVMRREGHSTNRKRVYSVMKEEHLLREAHFPRPRKPSKERLIAEQPNQVWSTDFTDILTKAHGVCHLMTIADACRREVQALEFLPNFGAREALTVVEQAVMQEFPKTCRAEGVVLKTDCGSHFTARIFREGV